jgi:glycosyltransferase involved in cell wall biosynthesis
LGIAINQGSGMNVDRGLEEAVSAVAGMEGWLLLLVGSGDAIPSLKEKVTQEGWQGKVKFIDRMPYDQLLHYTAAADVGLSLDKDSNINYRFSLPNKLFDYIHCNTPVVTSRVVEVKRIVEDYNVGLTVHVENILALRRSIAAVAEHREAYEPGLKHAQEALSWEKECIPIRNFYAQFL